MPTARAAPAAGRRAGSSAGPPMGPAEVSAPLRECQAVTPFPESMGPVPADTKSPFVGDIVGGIGRRTLEALLPAVRERLEPDFVVVNGENAAGGVGITPKVARQLFDAGVDAITLGNHAYRHRDVYGYLDSEPRILRPANFLRSQPGHGWCVVERDGVRLGVVSLSGNLFMNAGRQAFSEADAALGALKGKVDHVLVDMHAEATSEKVGMGWYLDGRATAVVGTHTHVPTADARVLPGGTAYISDVGMTGPRGGVIGVKREQAIRSMATQLSEHFETSDEDPWLNAVLIRCSQPLRADAIEQLLVPAHTDGSAPRPPR